MLSIRHVHCISFLFITIPTKYSVNLFSKLVKQDITIYVISNSNEFLNSFNSSQRHQTTQCPAVSAGLERSDQGHDIGLWSV